MTDDDASGNATMATRSATASSRPTWQEKLEQAKSHKQDGNELYKQKQYKAAVRKYHHGLLYVKGIESAQQTGFLPFSVPGGEAEPTSSNMAEVKSVKVDLYNNLAGLQLQLCSIKTIIKMNY